MTWDSNISIKQPKWENVGQQKDDFLGTSHVAFLPTVHSNDQQYMSWMFFLSQGVMTRLLSLGTAPKQHIMGTKMITTAILRVRLYINPDFILACRSTAVKTL